MKKVLAYLVASLMVLMCILAYDIIKFDGNILLNPLLNIDSNYTSDYSTGDSVNKTNTTKSTSTKNKITVTTPDVIKYNDVTVNEISADEVSVDSDMPEVTEVDEVADADRGYEFYFGFLSDKEKKCYREMYNAFLQCKSGNIIPTCEEDEMERVVSAIRNDHPEFFYVGDLGYTHYTMGGQVQRTTLNAKYLDSGSVIESQRRMVETEAKAIIDSIPAGADEYGKVKHVYESIIKMTEYDLNSPENQTITSVLLYKRSVCAGYARTMQYILNKIGIPTTLVEGVSLKTGEQHAWNLCKLSDGYYYVDVTWGDASYTNNADGNDKVESVNYDYLLVTSEELLRTHKIDSQVEMPVCTAIDNNYYVREGLYLSEYNRDYIRELFDNAYANGQDCVSFKCANRDVFADAVDDLIKGNNIFDMLEGSNKTVSYIKDEDQRTICFWL